MDYVRSHNLAQSTAEKGAYLLSRLRELQKRHKEIGDVDGLGLAIRIEMTQKDGITPNRRLTDTIFQEGMKANIRIRNQEYGLVLDIGGYYKNVFTLAPALTISYEEMDLFIDLFEALLIRCAL
jgi:4-aminobutyrate aminotransferase-like enzyme